MTISRGKFCEVMGHFPTGVAVITTLRRGIPAGMAVNSFTSVSLDPPLVSFCPTAASATWREIEQAGRFCVNILRSDQEGLCRRFAARDTDRFRGVEWSLTGGGVPRLAGVAGWIDCVIEDTVRAGDHVIAMGRVIDLDVESGESPLVFFQGGYRELSRP